MAYKFWTNVGVTMQSAIATAKTITAITAANPGVATSTAHGFENGDYLLLSVPGVSMLDQRVVRVAAKATDTFQLEGIDTTNMTGFTTGTAQKITFGTAITSATGVNASGGDAEKADITTIHSNVRRRVPVVASPLSVALDLLWDPAEAGQVALKAAFDAMAPRGFKVRFADGATMVFYGYVSAPLVPTGTAQGVVTTAVEIESQNSPTLYAT